MNKNNDIKIHNFWYICITLRFILALLPLIYNNLINKNNKTNTIKKIASVNKYILIIFGLGFLRNSIFGSNDEIQLAKVFWHETRIIHAFLFFMAGMVFNNYKLASTLLFTDLGFSIIYRFLNGHFK